MTEFDERYIVAVGVEGVQAHFDDRAPAVEFAREWINFIRRHEPHLRIEQNADGSDARLDHALIHSIHGNEWMGGDPNEDVGAWRRIDEQGNPIDQPDDEE